MADWLLHPTRQRMLMAVAADPGMTFRGLARRLGLANGTASHHVRVLKRHRLLVETQVGCTRRFFPVGFQEVHAASTAILREPALRTLHDWISQNPGANQTTIIQGMAWSHSTTQNRLARLVAAGAVSRHQVGRRLQYHATLIPTPAMAPVGALVAAEA